MKQVGLFLAAAVCLMLMSASASAATYFSQGSVAPNTPANWNTVRAGGGSSPANFTSGDTFVIQNGHNMTTSATWSISGTGSKLQIENGGTLTATNTVTLAAATTFQIDSGGTYVHNNTAAYGSTIFQGTESFDAASTVIINNSNTTGPSGVAFGNLTIDFTSDPGGAVNCAGGLTTINGSLTITSTSTREFRLTGTTDFTLNIAGNYSQSGGTLNPANGNNGTATINITGDFSLTGGSLAQSGGNGNTSGNIFFNKSGTQTFTSGGTISGNVDFTVNSGSTLNVGTSVVTGRTFTLSSGATLGIGSSAGITSAGATGNVQTTNRSFSTGANYTYNGTTNQAAGNGLPTTVNNFTVSNSGAVPTNIVTLGANVAVSGALTVNMGVLRQGGANLTVTGATTINSGGTLSVVTGTTGDFTGAGVTVNSGGGWEVFGGLNADRVVITLSGNVSNAGLIRFDSGNTTCGESDFIQVRSSVSGTQRTWSGAGTFLMQDVDVKDQNKSGTAITVSSGTDSGNNTNWTFNNNCNAPTAVALTGFGALKDDSGNVLLQWKTGYEVNNLGFNLYRDAAGQRTRINPSLIAGSALLGRAGTAFTAGFSYAWMDTPAAGIGKAGATYWLEDIDVNGRRIMHGPISAIPGGKLPAQAQSLLLSQLQTHAPPATEQRQFLPGRTTIITKPTGNLGKGVGKGKPPVPAGLQTQWDIAGQPGVKLLVNKDGWYRVTQAELAAAGFDVTRDPFFMQLYVDGEEVPFRVNGGNTGRLVAGDSIEFYGRAIDTTYTNQHAYYLINGAQAGRRIPVMGGDGGDESRAASFDTTIERRDRSIYFSGLKNGETENWFGAIVTDTPVSQTLKVAHLDADSTREVTLEVALQGVFDDGDVWPDHAVKVMLNGEEVGTMSFDGLQHPVNQFVINSKFIQEGDNTVTLQSLNGSLDINLIDYVRLTFSHLFEADNNALLYTANGREMVTINGFSTAKVRVYDLTDPNNITELQGDIQPSGKAYRVTVAAPDAGPRVLFAVGEKALQPVAAAVANQPSSWNKLTQGADVLIITHKDFVSSVAPLKALRQAQGYAVAVVDVEDLYDEFNYGAPSPQAIKDFLTRTSAWKKVPRYVVLVGDASYDPKNYLGLGANDFVPTRMLETLEMEAASDDWLADLDGDEVAEVAIGRLPVRTATDATLLIQKIITYEQEGNPEGALLVSDQNDGYDFESTNAGVKSLLPDGMAVTEIKRSQMTDTSAHQAIVEGINRGPKVVNYAGHGSFGLWRGNLLLFTDAAQMRNGANLPFVITMTCLNGQYNTPYDDSLAEALLKAQTGGAIAVWASSSLTMAGSHPEIDQELIRQLFTGFSATGNHVTFGEAVRRAKLMTGDSDIRRSWILFGDPTTKLR